jgi:DNA-directed RNA polymerase III subunit RPC2
MTEHLYREGLQGLFESSKFHDPLKDPRDKNRLIGSLRAMKGFSKQHIESFNEFINERLQKIVTSKVNYRVTSEADPEFFLEYESISVSKPTHETSYDEYSKVSKLYPNEARIADLTYSGDILVNIKYRLNGLTERRSNVKIGRMPIMLGSSCCHLDGKNEAELAMLKECPVDPKGYFIVRGTEKVLLIQEQMIENRIQVEKNVKLDTIIAGVTSYTV